MCSHTVHFLIQLMLMRNLRQSILEKRFVEFVREFMSEMYPERNYDQWIVDALASVNISLPHKTCHNESNHESNRIASS